MYQSIQKSEQYYTVTPCIALYFVMRCAAPNDKIQCNTGKYYTSDSECNISRYWMRKASRVKYPDNPEVWQQIPRAKGPRDLLPNRGIVWIFYEGCFQSSISRVTVWILRAFLYWLVHIPCIICTVQIISMFKATFIKCSKTVLSLQNICCLSKKFSGNCDCIVYSEN